MNFESLPFMKSESNGQVLWYVERGDTLSGIVKSAFRLSDGGAIHRKVLEIAKFNTHLKSIEKIYPGNVVALGASRSGIVDVPQATDLQEIESILGPPSSENRFLLDNYEVLQGLSEYEDPNEACRVPASMSPHQLLPAFAPGAAVVTGSGMTLAEKTAWKTFKGFAKTGEKMAKGDLGNWLSRSPHVWRELEGNIVRNLKADFVRQPDGVLGLIPKGNRAFNIGGKVIVVKQGGSGFYSYAKRVKAAKNFGKSILKPAGKIFKVIDTGVSAKTIYEAWDKPGGGRVAVTETAKWGTSLGMGVAAGAMAAPVCGALTLTTGVGGVACYLVIFVVVPWATSEAVGWGAGQVYDKVAPIYQSPAPVFLGM